MRQSIRRRLTILFIVLAIGPLLLVGVTLAYQSLIVQQKQALDLEDAVARRVSTQVDAFITRLERELRVVAQDLRELDPDKQQYVLSNLPSYPKVFQELSLIDANGKEQIHLSRLQVITPAELADQSTSPAFTEPKATGQVYYGPVHFDSDTGEPSLTISVPTFEFQTGQVNGVLAATVRFKEVWDLMASVQSSNGDETVYIVDSQSRVIAHLNPSVVLRNTKFEVPATDGIHPGLNGDSVVLAHSTVQFGDQTFSVVAEKPVPVALALAIQTVIITIVLLIAALALATVEAVVAARQLVQPIQVLAAAAEALTVKSESFDPAMLNEIMARGDELGQLARVFQTMGHQVRTREETLKKEVQELRIEIDEAKKAHQVAEIVESEYFQELKEKARRIRAGVPAEKAETGT